MDTPDKEAMFDAERCLMVRRDRRYPTYRRFMLHVTAQKRPGSLINRMMKAKLQVFELAKALLRRMVMVKVIQPILANMKEKAIHPEGVRHVVREYFLEGIIGSNDEENFRAAMAECRRIL